MVVVAPPRAVVLSALAMLLIGFASISTLRSCIAAELIMINSPICEWCDTWEDEVGVVYARTEQGRKVPLRRIDIDDMPTSALRTDRPVTFTPTFLLVDGAREVGRITGYPGESHFWYFLDEILKKALYHGCSQPAARTATVNNETGNRLC